MCITDVMSVRKVLSWKRQICAFKKKKNVLSLDSMKVLPLEVGHHVTQYIFEATTGYSSNPN